MTQYIQVAKHFTHDNLLCEVFLHYVVHPRNMSRIPFPLNGIVDHFQEVSALCKYAIASFSRTKNTVVRYSTPLFTLITSSIQSYSTVPGQGLFYTTGIVELYSWPPIIHPIWLVLCCYYCKHICTCASVYSNIIYTQLCIKPLLKYSNVVNCKL